MRFLHSLVVPLLVTGTLAKAQLQFRDSEAINSANISAGVDEADTLRNIANFDNSDSFDDISISGSADDVDKGGASRTFCFLVAITDCFNSPVAVEAEE